MNKMVLLKEKDIRIISYLRRDSRSNLTEISKKTKVPISTIFDKLKKYAGDLIKKNTIIVDFKKLGFDFKVNFILKIKPELREQLRSFLEKNMFVNTIYRINNGYDFYIEAYFKTLSQLQEFEDAIDRIGLEQKQLFYVLEEIKEQEFICEPEIAKLLTTIPAPN